ncbi:prepilin peptidase [Luteolibacter arcticus]|uniref:Prepilin peptidase n=1 Tax=Luteolibacter arcticus TaxID=1581411 RepID=A0ABT3GIL0_9BACT|nr:prepilin peptidase [Luteolibacter arcticus]MCW1923347.1 prepilin peptidase [Luteolibacter arcticus]
MLSLRLNGATLIEIFPSLAHPVWYVPTFLLGACIGSFLNVVIYRVPIGLSVNEPKRSFCPKCKADIPMRLNIPLVSWLWLRGKCANCKAPIAFRYFGVELLTALLFAALWWFLQSSVPLGQLIRLELGALLPLWVMAALFVAITFIDAEHMIIPTSFTTAISIAGLGAAALWPRLTDLAGWAGWDPTLKDGLKHSVVGWIMGFCGLWCMVRLGKLAFGKKKVAFPEPVPWKLIEPDNEVDPIFFEMNGEKTAWWDLFFRKTDRLVIEATEVVANGEGFGAGEVTIREHEIVLPGGKVIPLDELKSLEGMGTGAVIPREAMGMGDVHLLGAIGAFFGWAGVLFGLFAASLYAIVAAALGRIGFGRPLPFGPFLILGAFTWMFGGWKLAEWYFSGLMFMR